jgi:beta-lactamase class A
MTPPPPGPLAPAASAAPAPRQSSPAGPSAGQALASAVAAIISADGGHAAVAVDDLTTGQTAAYNAAAAFDTASIVKVDILWALMYQAAQAGQPLTAQQQDLATKMIENSDNDAATALWNDAGGAAGITAANKTLGLTQTTAGTAGQWGLTSTTVTDQITLLRQVFTADSLLPAASRAYIGGLMSHVEDGQRWGVPAAADPGTGFAVKNGWLPYPTTQWYVNSLGRITAGGHKLLVAVESGDNQSEDAGIGLVQQIAKAAATAVTAS